MKKNLLSAIALLICLLLVVGVSASCGSKDGASKSGADSKLIERYKGDWNGCVRFVDGKEKYETLTGIVAAIARFNVDSKGKITPFIGLDVEDTPIEDLTAKFDKNDIVISGKWIKAEFKNVRMTESGGTLSTRIDISKGTGSVSLVFNFRRLDDTGWTDEDPGFSESQINDCMGKTFEELAEMIGYGKSDYPEAQAASDKSDAGKKEGKKMPSGSIIGSWEYAIGGYTYTFNTDGTGSYAAGSTVMEFTYEDSGDKVKILYKGNTVPNEFAYTISGNTLSIEDSFGSKVDYKKK